MPGSTKSSRFRPQLLHVTATWQPTTILRLGEVVRQVLAPRELSNLILRWSPTSPRSCVYGRASGLYSVAVVTGTILIRRPLHLRPFCTVAHMPIVDSSEIPAPLASRLHGPPKGRMAHLLL
jgi:hypothetical protein